MTQPTSEALSTRVPESVRYRFRAAPSANTVDALLAVIDKLQIDLDQALARCELAEQNTRRMALLAEAFVYEPHRITEGGLMAQVNRALTGQDVEYEGRDDAQPEPDTGGVE